MAKKKLSEQLPILARKALETCSPDQYIAIHQDMQSRIFEAELFSPAMNLLMQLKPNSRIQYVMLEELEYREKFLEIGLIKQTKKGGADTYIVPKNVAFCGIEK
ncbi:hypothetical protein MYD45_000379 [Vibrio parahaemolyticus]|uniref:hypothetical protein n=1 Tax=Vibrio parahaemolyticus TaxID=670 RepID=UPI001A8E406A|nr:hypothetical protein [Vibrio parahaemolyticus]EJC6861132.1 hypothetical protein [Vibrio parahaemolyticus]EJC7038201.1 hypothetical protein [Vibrio parahaemolyticus]EJC7063916.1 hypothetical protein [Vibrio parahaemolyticus]MBO0194870.1 hypothetical protein [Vibrio parahaemolyticus]